MTVYLVTEIFDDGEEISKEVVGYYMDYEVAISAAFKLLTEALDFLPLENATIEHGADCAFLYFKGRHDLTYRVTSKELK